MKYRVWKQVDGIKDYVTFDHLPHAKEYTRTEVIRGIIDRAWIVEETGNTIYECSLDIYGAICVGIDYTEGEKAMNYSRNKIAEIKAVRAIHLDMGLRDAKEFVEARSTEQVAMYILENVYANVNGMRDKLSGYDQVQSSLDLYKKDFDAMVKTLDQKDNLIENLEKENKNLLNQRNTILAMLTKEQILDLYIASQSQTE